MTVSLVTQKVAAPFAKPWGNYLLNDIVETHAPETISWLPQTIGWQLLVLLALIFIFVKSYRAYQKYQRNAYRREALAWLKICNEKANSKLYQQLPALLRKTALNAFNRAEISQLSGSHWEHWLDKQCDKTSFTRCCPDLLYQLSYKPIEDNKISQHEYQILIEQISLWIKYHKDAND